MWKILEQILFPRFCINCKKEGSFLCEDCFFLIEVMEDVYCLCDEPKRGKKKCKGCISKKLNGIYFASHLKGPLAERLFNNYTKEPFLKDLSYPLAGLVMRHFLSVEIIPQNFSLHPLPVTNKKTAGYDINKEVAQKIGEHLDFSGEKVLLFSVLYTKEIEEEAKKLKGKEVYALSVFRR